MERAKYDYLIVGAGLYGAMFAHTANKIDYLIREYNGPANIGDKILIRNIGAYSYNTTNNFITYGCKNVVQMKDIIF